MRKVELIDQIVESTGIAKVDVMIAIESFVGEVKKSLAKGEPVTIRGFGSFIVKERQAKIGRVVSTGVPVEIPAHCVPAFRPAKEFLLKVKESNKVHEEQSHK